jgi:hypothetical protein
MNEAKHASRLGLGMDVNGVQAAFTYFLDVHLREGRSAGTLQ